jgi:hypothetical protein
MPDVVHEAFTAFCALGAAGFVALVTFTGFGFRGVDMQGGDGCGYWETDVADVGEGGAAEEGERKTAAVLLG